MKNIKRMLILFLVATMLPFSPAFATENTDIEVIEMQNISANNTVSQATLPQWDQSIIDDAVSQGYVSFALDSSYRWSTSLDRSQAVYFMALVVHNNPSAKASNGTLVIDRLLAQINSMITPGREPSCMGGLAGWIDNAAAQTLVLAKNTPDVWNRLSADQKEKCDFIMKALAIAGNYTHNYAASPSTDLSQVTSWANSWNPNHVEGYVGIMIAANLYFGGADAVNKIFSEFSYDTYTKQMQKYGYTNMLKHFQATGKKLLENGGKDALGGTVVGAKVAFTYKDLTTGARVEYDPLKLYYSLAIRMYTHPVRSKIYDSKKVARGYIADGTTSPFEGQIGMGCEFYSMDANGIRTSADYVSTGIRNNIITRATLQALGLWTGEDAKKATEIMYVGMEDFLYKVSPAHGYIGYAKGASLGLQSESISINTMGYVFFKQIWQKYLKDNNPRAFIYALYDKNDQIISMIMHQTTASGELKKTATTFKENATVAYYKAYTWDTLSSVMPLTSVNSGTPTN